MVFAYSHTSNQDSSVPDLILHYHRFFVKINESNYVKAIPIPIL